MPVELLTPFTKVNLEPKKTEHRRGVGLFWGAFNPVHMAHLIIADQVRQQLHLDEVRFIPENPDRHVKTMLQLVLDGKMGLTMDEARCDVDRNRSIYQTLRTITEAAPDIDFYFIVGGDLIASLPRWERIDELLQMAQFVGVQRPRYRAGTSYPLLWVDVPLLDISGRQIRRQIAKKICPNFLVPPQVLDYIRKEKLYV